MAMIFVVFATGCTNYDICKIYSGSALTGIIIGFIDALRQVKIARTIHNPGEMKYACDYSREIVFDLQDGSSFKIELDEGYRIHKKGVVFDIGELKALSSMYEKIKKPSQK